MEMGGWEECILILIPVCEFTNFLFLVGLGWVVGCSELRGFAMHYEVSFGLSGFLVFWEVFWLIRLVRFVCCFVRLLFFVLYIRFLWLEVTLVLCCFRRCIDVYFRL